MFICKQLITLQSMKYLPKCFDKFYLISTKITTMMVPQKSGSSVIGKKIFSFLCEDCKTIARAQTVVV